MGKKDISFLNEKVRTAVSWGPAHLLCQSQSDQLGLYWQLSRFTGLKGPGHCCPVHSPDNPYSASWPLHACLGHHILGQLQGRNGRSSKQSNDCLSLGEIKVQKPQQRQLSTQFIPQLKLSIWVQQKSMAVRHQFLLFLILYLSP